MEFLNVSIYGHVKNRLMPKIILNLQLEFTQVTWNTQLKLKKVEELDLNGVSISTGIFFCNLKIFVKFSSPLFVGDAFFPPPYWIGTNEPVKNDLLSLFFFFE